MRSFAQLARIIAALLVALSLSLASSPSSAFAGTNGQQLQVYFRATTTSCGWISMSASRVTVSGYNQNNQYSTWSQPVTTKTCGMKDVVTQNWWWRGSVSVTITYRNFLGFTSSRKCWVNVPIQQKGDIFTVTC